MGIVLEGKTILIISPQDWGEMLISKHHYAIALAKKGNKVYFLNPPRQGKYLKNSQVEISESDLNENVFLVTHYINFPYNLKFHASGVFHFFMKAHIKKLLKKISEPLDIVWSFDLGNLYPFKFFPLNARRIFHPVDEPLNKDAINSAIGAEIIFSVTNEILNKYKQFSLPSYLIPHGVSDIFFQSYERENGNGLKVGVSGNLLRPDIDRDTLLEIVNQNKEVDFNFFGAYTSSNIGGGMDEGAKQFIEALSQQKNVKLHGMLNQANLAKALHQMDAFLICYDVQKDQSKGTNYHKIMEFLSTGKVIVSNNVSTYSGRADLVKMVNERDTNKELPNLFTAVINCLSENNNQDLQNARINFAKENLYIKHINVIEQRLKSLKAK